MAEIDLFREEALRNRNGTWLGTITLAKPLSLRLAITVSLLFSASVVSFIYFASYTSRTTVNGQIVPSTGIVKILAPQQGIVISRKIKEGETVSAGQVLVEIASLRQTTLFGINETFVAKQIADRRRSIFNELEKTRTIHREEENKLLDVITNQREEIDIIRIQIEAQKNRVNVAEISAKRSTELETKGFVSKDQLSSKNAEYWDQTSRLHVLVRDKQQKELELQKNKRDLVALPARQLVQLEQLQRSLASIEQERSENESKRSSAIVAPESGVATAVTVDVGQVVEASRVIATILPREATLQAHLYAPTNTVGLLKKADKVLIRVQSFPFQKFGQVHGTIRSISGATLNAQELNSMGMPTGVGTQPVYLIIVNLNISVDRGFPIELLHPGMQVEADILQETRSVYEWIFDPVIDLYKRT